MRIRAITLLAAATLTIPLSACAGWQEWVKQAEQEVNKVQQGQGPTQSEIVAGLKQALEVGTERAVKLLGHDGGFLNDGTVKIPMPEKLRNIDKALRDLGQGKVADEFVASMNHAAEQAVPKAVDIFGAAIRSMTLADAQKILQGPDDAATRYFREHTGNQLTEAMLPVVRDATTRVGVTRSYKDFVNRAGFLSQLVDRDSLDLDRYITGKALDGLFLKLAEEEKRIRQDPVARTTELLRKVFGGTN